MRPPEHEAPHERSDPETDELSGSIDPGAADIPTDREARGAERTNGMLSARCDEEGANYLAIDLAHEIVERVRTVQEARTFCGEQIVLAHEGERSPYVDGLLFEPQRRAVTGDPTCPRSRASRRATATDC